MLVEWERDEYLIYCICNNMYISYEKGYNPVRILFADECKILNKNHSKYWIKDDDNNYLPEGWEKKGFLEKLVDDLDPLSIEKFKLVKDKIDEEFAYYFKDNSKELQDPYLSYEAEAIGNNWVLCPKCNEAFETNSKNGVIVCPNIACREELNNPYAKKGYPSCLLADKNNA